MSRGIQPGTTATTLASGTLDSDLQLACTTAFLPSNLMHLVPDPSEWAHTRNISKQRMLELLAPYQPNLEPSHISSIHPDGGVFWTKNLPRLAFEAKYQKNEGNAIERWFKNFYVAQLCNPAIAYVSFFSGEGATHPTSVMQRTVFPAMIAANHQFNVLYATGPSIFTQTTPFNLQQLQTIVNQAIHRVATT